MAVTRVYGWEKEVSRQMLVCSHTQRAHVKWRHLSKEAGVRCGCAAETR